MSDRVKAENDAHALVMGRYFINRDPLYMLKELRASIGYRGGYCIYLTEEKMKQIDDVIAFNEERN